MYYIKTSSKQIKQNKKENYRIFENMKYSNFSGYDYYYTLTDYNKNFIENFSEFHLLENYLKKKECNE